jgi:hypothetical protein
MFEENSAEKGMTVLTFGPAGLAKGERQEALKRRVGPRTTRITCIHLAVPGAIRRRFRVTMETADLRNQPLKGPNVDRTLQASAKTLPTPHHTSPCFIKIVCATIPVPGWRFLKGDGLAEG